MGERLLCKQEVIGSIPFTSTTAAAQGRRDERQPCAATARASGGWRWMATPRRLRPQRSGKSQLAAGPERAWPAEFCSFGSGTGVCCLTG